MGWAGKFRSVFSAQTIEISGAATRDTPHSRGFATQPALSLSVASGYRYGQIIPRGPTGVLDVDPQRLPAAIEVDAGRFCSAVAQARKADHTGGNPGVRRGREPDVTRTIVFGDEKIALLVESEVIG